MTMKELKRLCGSSVFSPIYIFYGSETFLTGFYSKKLCDNINDTFGMADFNFSEFEGDKVKLETLADTIEAMPMFAERKCVLLKDFDFSSLNASDAEFFLECCIQSPDSTILVMTYSSLFPDQRDKKWAKLFDVISSKGTVAECSSPSRKELVMWMRRAAELDNATIDDATADYIIEKVGIDMRRLRGEIAKLSAYADGQILPEHVDAVAVKHLDAKVYDMVRCVSSRKFADAYRLLGEMMETGEEPSMLLGAISGAFADIYRAKLGASAGKSSKEIAADFGFKGREFRVTNALRDANRFTDEYLYRCVEAIAVADNDLKSSATESRLVFEKLIAAIAAAGAVNV